MLNVGPYEEEPQTGASMLRKAVVDADGTTAAIGTSVFLLVDHEGGCCA